ncbi:p21-activated protein kinase-interacting protein 1-like protein [Thelohanellus kitauei]|uniref:p21-activated protein kinase-interacting protein 1-like protein n=1 Tax=Thelohanellus kitauei TaxID=669202 RepID=A0A0C2JIM5_THEKT|nr:p21-activated protein kinase-interacting protein 1-like protein [Thelohanellus kitauei]
MASFAVGTYRGSVHCFKLSCVAIESADDKKLEITPLFSDDSHTGSIKTLANCKKYLASSSTDDSIRVYDVGRRREVASLIKISCMTIDKTGAYSLGFYRNKILVATCSDGYVRAWSTNGWVPILEVNAHEPKESSFTFIETSPLFLSVGIEKSIKMWNLSNQKMESKSELHSKPLKICAGKDFKYSIIFEDCFKVYSYKFNSCTKIEKLGVTSIGFIGDYLVYGGEFKYIAIFSIGEGVDVIKWDIGYNRTRDLKVLDVPSFGPVIITVHSEGYVVIYDARFLNEQQPPSVLCEFPVNDRLICCSAENSC